MSNLSRTTKRRRVDEELNCIMSNLQDEDDQSNHGEVPQQATVTLIQTSANNYANLADISLPTKPFEGTFIK